MKKAYRWIIPGILLLPAVYATALPDMVSVYEKDPYAKIKGGSCALCHESAFGGSRNAFGDAFGDNLHQITPLLRAQFPDYFAYPVTKVNDNLTIHFSDPEKKFVVIESNGKKVEVGVDEVTVDGKKAVTPKD